MPSRRPPVPPRDVLRAPLVIVPILLAVGCADQLPVTPRAGSVGPNASIALPGLPARGRARYVVEFASTAPVGLPAAAVAASGGRLAGALPVARGLVVANVSNPAALAAVPGVVRVEESPKVLLDPVRPAEGGFSNVASAGVHRSAVTGVAGVDPNGAAWIQSGVQWDMQTMRVPAAWALGKQGLGARVCIIDTGLDSSHQELAGSLVASTSFVVNDTADTTKGYSDPTLDSVGHGSHLAGTVAAKGIVVAGVAPKASLMIAKVFAASGGSSYDLVANATVWCTDHGADVINLSLGSLLYTGGPDGSATAAYVQAAMDYATSRGVVVVAAAGNENVQFPNPLQLSIPALVHGVVSVGATGPLSKFPLVRNVPDWNPSDTAQVWRSPDSRAYYSNFGSAVTVFAPGGNLGYNLAWPFRIVNGRIQGVDLDGVYSVCSSSAGQQIGAAGARNVGGVPTYPAAPSCEGATDAYASIQGTSMATPHVAGLAALITAEIGGERSAARMARVVQCITRSTDKIGPADVYGGGRVNALSAIQLLHKNGC